MTCNPNELLTLLPLKHGNSMLHGPDVLDEKKKPRQENRAGTGHSWLKGLACEPGQTHHNQPRSHTCFLVWVSTLKTIFLWASVFYSRKENDEICVLEDSCRNSLLSKGRVLHAEFRAVSLYDITPL